LTFGFYNFKTDDVFYSGLPDKLGTIALVPTLEFGTGKDALRVIIGNPFPVETPEDRGVGME
jgi:hypothetical protein